MVVQVDVKSRLLSKYIDVCLFDIGVNIYEFQFYIEDRKKFKDLICNF